MVDYHNLSHNTDVDCLIVVYFVYNDLNEKLEVIVLNVMNYFQYTLDYHISTSSLRDFVVAGCYSILLDDDDTVCYFKWFVTGSNNKVYATKNGDIILNYNQIKNGKRLRKIDVV
jgi:hypothetical protein